MKRHAVVALAVAGLSFAGCGGGNGDSVTARETVTVPAEPATVTVPGPDAGTAGEALASPEIVAMLDDLRAAYSTGDANVLSAFYTEDAVLEDHDADRPVVSRGSDQIGRYLAGFPLEAKATGPIVRLGSSVVAEGLSPLANPGPEPYSIMVYILDPNGKIVREWILPAREIAGR